MFESIIHTIFGNFIPIVVGTFTATVLLLFLLFNSSPKHIVLDILISIFFAFCFFCLYTLYNAEGIDKNVRLYIKIGCLFAFIISIAAFPTTKTKTVYLVKFIKRFIPINALAKHFLNGINSEADNLESEIKKAEEKNLGIIEEQNKK